jgi:hypothetical protein
LIDKAISADRSVNILLVAGESSMSRFVRQILAEAGVAGRLHAVGDHCEALAYLRKDRPYLGAPEPDIVLFGAARPADCQCDVAGEVERNPQVGHVRVLHHFDAAGLVAAVKEYGDV